MAKKAGGKKAAKKVSGKSAGKTGGKSGKSAKASKAKKPAKAPKPAPRNPLEPYPVDTGSGATPIEIGQSLVEMFNQGKWEDIEKKWYSKDLTSIEGVGVHLAWVGYPAVRAKGEEWMKEHQIHGATAEGPFVGSTGFSVRFRMDVETRSTGTREIMDEVAVYTVQDGKIVIEEFMYRV